MNPDDSPKVKELREQLANSSVDVVALESEVFSHLYSFFRRYYSEGDFISLRRYKEGVYAIPYEGEEVKLHWANHDQYYIKSSEHFRDYTFVLDSGKRVRIHLVAASTEQDNKKEAAGKERRFVICAEDPVYEENGELYIRFEYRPVDGKKKQDALNKEAVAQVLASEGIADWVKELGKLAPTESNKERTVLEKHLMKYTSRNTFDYFIHKDLGGFLRRELDFYIKNEVMHLDDIENETVPRVGQYLSKIKVIRKIAHKIIQFLKQLEDFQKRLWLKKKFVFETNYCVTVDRVPEELYSEIIKNDAQQEEWIKIFSIDQIKKDLVQSGFSAPLAVDFLKKNSSLVVDTRYFSRAFTEKLLSSISEIDRSLDGVCINSDNFQALMLLETKFRDKVDCIFIDPPYNTGVEDFVYKDQYQHSSWLSMIHDRVAVGRRYLSLEGSFWITLDDREIGRFRLNSEDIFGSDHFMGNLAWEKVYSPRMDAKIFSNSFDHLLVFSKSVEWTPNRVKVAPNLSQFPHEDETGRRYRSDPLRKWGKGSLRVDSRCLYKCYFSRAKSLAVET